MKPVYKKLTIALCFEVLMMLHAYAGLGSVSPSPISGTTDQIIRKVNESISFSASGGGTIALTVNVVSTPNLYQVSGTSVTFLPDAAGSTHSITFTQTHTGTSGESCSSKSWTYSVHVPKATITGPESGDCILVGKEVRYDVTLTPAALTGYTPTYAWSVIEGTCNPSSAASKIFDTIIMSQDNIRVKVIVTVLGVNEEAIRGVLGEKPEMTSLSWDEDYDLLEGATGSSAITDPVWTKALGASTETKNEPGAYKKNAQAKADLKITGDRGLTNSTGVQVKGTGNTENFAPTSVTFHNWTWANDELQILSSTLYNSVNFYDSLNVTWAYRTTKIDGSWGPWIEMNESRHKLYTTHDDPVDPESTPHVDILDLACRWGKNGATIEDVCTGFLNNGFHARYTWSGDCYKLANDFVMLSGSVGISGSMHKWQRRGTDTSGSVGWMNEQKTKAIQPVGDTNPAHAITWRYHQWAEADGIQYDPSAASKKAGTWGDYEEFLFTNYYEVTSAAPFATTLVANQSGQSLGCENYPTNCIYDSGYVEPWRGPDKPAVP